MNTTAAIFFLILGQAGGQQSPQAGGLAIIPAHYLDAASCAEAGEFARAANQGLSFLSYTCVPASVNEEATPARFEVLWPAKATLAASVSKSAAGCGEVCEAKP
jgi:hypothetical protein